MIYLKKILFIFFLTLNFCTKLIAQKDSINYDNLANSNLSEILNTPVSGVSKYEETTNETPASVIVFTDEDIELNSYSDLSDLLKNVPGIDIIDNARGFGEYYSIRGIGGNSRFLVLINGKKINPASGTFLSVGNSIPVKFAKRVEIIFGPTSAMYGSDAFAGIINIVTKNPEHKINISAETEYGTANTINSDIAVSFKKSENLDIFLSAHFSVSDGPDFTGRDSVFDIITKLQPPLKNKFEQPVNDHFLFLKADYKNLSITLLRQKFNEGNALGIDPKLYVYNKESKWEMSNNAAWISYRKNFSPHKILTIETAYINHTQNPETQFLELANPETLSETFSQYMTGIDNSYKASITYQSEILKKAKLIAGTDYEYTQSIPPYANDEVFGKPIKYEEENADIIKNELLITEQRLAGFLQINYSPSPKFNFVLGGRYDFSLLSTNTFNPRTSFIFSPKKNTVFKILYGRAFQAPSLFYQYEQFGTPSSVMLSVSEVRKIEPNWKLKNQIVNSFELNLNKKIKDKFELNISAYHNFLSNLIKREIFTDSAFNKYFGTADSAVYSTGIRNANIVNLPVFGVNLIAEYKFSDNLKLKFSYIFLDDEFASTDLYSIKASNHKFLMNIVFLNVLKYFDFSVNMKLTGKINNKNLEYFPDGKQDGYFNTDISLRASNFIKKATFYVKINNVFNTDYSQCGILDSSVYLPEIPQNMFYISAGMQILISK